MSITLFEVYKHYMYEVSVAGEYFIKNLNEYENWVTDPQPVEFSWVLKMFLERFTIGQLEEIDPKSELMIALSQTLARDVKSYVDNYLQFEKIYGVQK